MFNMAERWGFHRGSNPVRLVKFLREDNLQFQTISEEEERALIAECPPYLQDMVTFAINTRLRSGEIFYLKWEDVDIEERRIRVMVRRTRRYIELPLNDAAVQILAAWRGMRRGPCVFYNQETGDRFKDVKLGLKKAMKRAGLKGITWHTFRHTFASRLVQHGADIVTVKELLGHSTIVVTMRYAHSNDESKRRAVAKLSAGDSDKIVTIVKNRAS
jgi:integrase